MGKSKLILTYNITSLNWAKNSIAVRRKIKT
jgi:hypothetical protein